MTRGKILALVLAVSLLVNLVLAVRYRAQSAALHDTEAVLAARSYNEKALSFTKLFISDVLKAQDEISFETRLKLENAVRELKDQAIIDQWNSFVNAKTESDAQTAVKNLLGTLVDKIRS